MQKPVEASLARSAVELAENTGRLNAIAGCAIGAFHLLPVDLWRGRFGSFLLGQLELSPHRPWNTIFLPLDPQGAFELDLPIAPRVADAIPEDLEASIEMISGMFEGRSSSEAIVLTRLLNGVRSDLAELFPEDGNGFSFAARQARSDVRALALAHATKAVGADVIIRSHQTFLADPDTQLIE